MPRQARIDIPGLLQHLIIRGVAQSDILEDDKALRDTHRPDIISAGGHFQGCREFLVVMAERKRLRY
jgi:hypothetical protein